MVFDFIKYIVEVSLKDYSSFTFLLKLIKPIILNRAVLQKKKAIYS